MQLYGPNSYPCNSTGLTAGKWKGVNFTCSEFSVRISSCNALQLSYTTQLTRWNTTTGAHNTPATQIAYLRRDALRSTPVACPTAVEHSLMQRLRPQERSKFSWSTKNVAHVDLVTWHNDVMLQSNIADDMKMFVREVEELLNVISFVEIGR